MFALAFLLASLVSFDLPDTGGARHTSAEIASHKAAVLVFVATGCPISASYAPELARMFADYSPRGVAFYAVHSDRSVPAGEVAKYAREYRYPFPMLLDRAQRLARDAGAKITPEAVVLSPRGAVLYRGRIDDRYVDFGKARPQATRQDLRQALDAVLAGRPAAEPVTRALGCAIPFTAAPAAAARVTFTRDIAPILYRHCAGCHHQGDVAPFPLLTYDDAAKRAALMATVTASRYMPPWKPVPGYGRFQGERRLADAEIAKIREWAAAGAPEGNPADLPPAPVFPAGWRLGKPDLVVGMPQPFAVAADGPDLYQCFVIPLGVKQERYVRAAEFRPGNGRVVHHALMFLDSFGIARKNGPTYSCFGTPGFLPSGGLGGWAPGSGAIVMPAGTVTKLWKSTDLVVQIHFHPTGKPEDARASVGLYFTDKPPTRRLADIALVFRGIDIPAGTKTYVVRDHFTLPVDVEAVGIVPHAHYICKDMKGRAILPDGTRKWLLWIKDWDFNWQEQYRYATPVKLPAGTRLEMEFTYDNSADNPRNPNHPPKRVEWGPDTTDEMAGLHVQVIAVRNEDEEELSRALWGKAVRTLGIGFPKR